MSASAQLFDQFKKDGILLIKQAVAEEWFESLYLDFKTSGSRDGLLTNHDQENYAKASSGFANSDGGVIIWGVVARKDKKTGIDAAVDCNPIKSVRRFFSELNSQIVHLVSPGIDGIEHFRIEEPGNAEDGYIVTHVPKGEGLPHMALGPRQHRYYHRVGSSFVKMEPYVLADRFSRRPQPQLEFTCRLEGGTSSGGPGGTTYEVSIIVGIRNIGVGIALYPALALHETPTFKLCNQGLDRRGNFGLPERIRTPRRPDEAVRFFAGGVNDALHPGTELDVFTSLIQMHESERSHDDVVVRYELYCEGHAAKGEVTIPGSQIVRARTG
jgi:hypothetical protein